MLGHFGFSYVGLIFMIMLMVPNIIWAKNQPQGYTAENENKVLAVFLLGIYGKVIWMLIACVILGIGHIGIHWQHSKEL